MDISLILVIIVLIAVIADKWLHTAATKQHTTQHHGNCQSDTRIQVLEARVVVEVLKLQWYLNWIQVAKNCPNCNYHPWYKSTRCPMCGYGDNDGILFCPNCGFYTSHGTSGGQWLLHQLWIYNLISVYIWKGMVRTIRIFKSFRNLNYKIVLCQKMDYFSF